MNTKGFALGFALKKMLKASEKWPIMIKSHKKIDGKKKKIHENMSFSNIHLWILLHVVFKSFTRFPLLRSVHKLFVLYDITVSV